MVNPTVFAVSIVAVDCVGVVAGGGLAAGGPGVAGHREVRRAVVGVGEDGDGGADLGHRTGEGGG